MGPQRGDDAEALPVVAERLFRKAGFDVVYPRHLASLCCGQAFESQGLPAAADRKSAELEAALTEASGNGRWPIVFDTSPCAYRMQRFCGTRLTVYDSIAFIHDSGTAARDAGADPRAGGHPSGLQRAHDGDDRQALHDRAPLRYRGRHGPRCAVLRICRRQGLQPPRTQRTRTAALASRASGRLHARLFVEPDMRNRVVSTGAISVPLDHPSCRSVRKRDMHGAGMKLCRRDGKAVWQVKPRSDGVRRSSLVLCPVGDPLSLGNARGLPHAEYAHRMRITRRNR